MKRERRILFYLLAFGLASRLAALPWAMVQDADAVARIQAARQWLAAPSLITWGVWGPLHTYLIAAALALWPNPVLAPVVLSMLLTVATAALVYRFTREEFSPAAAPVAAFVFLLYPIAFRDSLMPVAEAPFTFFVMLAFWLAGRARRPGAPAWAALASGLGLTLAGALRYEAWLLTPLLGAVLFDRRSFRPLALFLLGAGLFPAFWMLGNWRATGDPLFSIHFTSRYVNEAEGYNLGVTARMHWIRTLFFPFTLFCGLTPPVFALCAAGLGMALARRQRCARWAVPLLGLMALLTWKAAIGDIVVKGRYMHLIGVLLIPFLAPLWSLPRLRRLGPRRLSAAVGLAALLMLPLSYAGLAGPALLASFYQKNITLIPRVPPPGPQAAAAVCGHLRPGDGLCLGFFGWAETYYTALQSRLAPGRIFLMPGARHETVDLQALGDWFRRNPAGILVLGEGSPLAPGLHPPRLALPGQPWALRVQPLGGAGTLMLYRYQLVDAAPKKAS